MLRKYFSASDSSSLVAKVKILVWKVYLIVLHRCHVVVEVMPCEGCCGNLAITNLLFNFANRTTFPNHVKT